jgi:spore germination cell wall hydrolase CwlJ-like protein
MSELAAKIWRGTPAAAFALIGLLAVSGLYLTNGPIWRLSPAWWGGPAAAPTRPRADARAKPATTSPAPSVEPQVFERLTPEQAALLNAAAPISKAPNPPAAPFVLATLSPVDRARAETCLAMAVYYEAANQGPDGEAAVAQVVLNRLRNPLFPKTVCGVVFQGSNLPTGCQFTFTCDGSLARPPSASGWRAATEIAKRALNGYVMRDVGEATHYHTIWVVPYWQTTVLKVAQLGAHVFYRWNGPLGQPAAFTGAYVGAEVEPRLPPGIDKSLLTAAPAPNATVAESTAAAEGTARTAEPAVAAAPVVALADQASLSSTISIPAAPANQGYFSRGGNNFQHLPMQ